MGGSGGGGDGSGAPPFTNGVSTLAGAAEPGYIDGNRDIGRLNNPVNATVGPDGKIYVADFDNGVIRVLDDSGTSGTVVAQQGFKRPFGLSFSGDTLYVTTDNDTSGKHTPLKSGSVWRVDIHAHTATNIVNSIGMPRGIVALKDGRLLLADYELHVIELLDPRSGALTVLAGTAGQAGYADGQGAVARFSAPVGVVQRTDGSVVIADRDNNRLRVVTLDGAVTTLAGSSAGFSDGAMPGVQFKQPQGLAIDGSGAIYVSDLGNYRIRKITGSNIETIAGDGNAGYIDDDDRMASELYGIEGLGVKADGSSVYVADGTRGDDVPYNRVRVIKMN